MYYGCKVGISRSVDLRREFLNDFLKLRNSFRETVLEGDRKVDAVRSFWIFGNADRHSVVLGSRKQVPYPGDGSFRLQRACIR